MDHFWASAVYEAMEKLNVSLAAGSAPPVDQFPLLDYIPEIWAQWNRRLLIPTYNAKRRRKLTEHADSKEFLSGAIFGNMACVNRTVKEGLRFWPVVTSGISHRANKETWFDGTLIPRDATVFVPFWALNRSIYEDADQFNPGRYLSRPRLAMDHAGSPDCLKRDHYVYGAGLRVCVEIHHAERTQWRIVAKNFKPRSGKHMEKIKMEFDNIQNHLKALE